MTQQDDITQAAQALREAVRDAIRKAYDDGYNDAKMDPDGTSTYCGRAAARHGTDALLSKLRAPVSSLREGFELTYAADADDPACATDLFHFTNGWRACVMSQVRAPVADERAAVAAVAGLIPPCASRRGNDFRDGYLEAQVDALRVLRALASAPVGGEAQKPVAWFIDWPDEPELGHYIAESPADSGRSRPLVFADASPQESTPVPEEPVYAYRRKGLDDFVTCDRERFDELSAKPRLFETRIFYAAPQASALATEYTRGRADGFAAGYSAALEKAAAAVGDHRKVSREWVPGSLWDTLSREAAARIRALKQPQADKDGGQQRHVNMPAADVDIDRQQHARDVAAAWAECRAEVGTAGWTVSESINYHGFFLHGWRAALSATQAGQGDVREA